MKRIFRNLRGPALALAFMLIIMVFAVPAFALRTNSLSLTPGPLQVFVSGSELFGVARTTGALTATPRVTSGIGLYINGSSVTSGDVLRLKTVDATLNGGNFISCINTANSSVFSIAEGGNTTIAGTLVVSGTTTHTGAVQFDSTITSGKSGSNGGLTVKATGGSTTFSVAGATGNTVVAGTLGVTGASTLTGNTGITGTLSVDSTSTLTGALTVKAPVTSGLNGATGVAGGITVLSGANPGTTTFSVAGATGNTSVAGTLGVTGASTLSSTLDVTGASTLVGALTVKNTVTSGLNGESGVAGGLTILDGANPGSTTFSVAGATGNTTIEGDLLIRASKLKIGAGSGTAVTATAAELNKLAGTSANVTQTNLDALTGGSGTSLHTHSLAAGATDVTASAAQVNLLKDAVVVVQHKRLRVITADLNSGVTLLAAVTGKKYRLIDCSLIAYGGAFAATANATGIAISGTQSSSAVKLYEVNLAQLGQSVLNKPGTASTAILADGASFAQCDTATAITVAAVAGTDLITATGCDVNITYVLE